MKDLIRRVVHRNTAPKDEPYHGLRTEQEQQKKMNPEERTGYAAKPCHILGSPNFLVKRDTQRQTIQIANQKAAQ